jgi:hypothetical protein
MATYILTAAQLNNRILNSFSIPSGGGGGVDPDAQAFITAAGITDPTQQSAINTLVVGMKADNIWTKMNAIYPFVGGTASAHKYNLKDPRDLDAAFRIVFNGGWTHNSNGIQSNGVNAYANTFAASNTTAIPNQANHWGIYHRQLATSGDGYQGVLDYNGSVFAFSGLTAKLGSYYLMGLQCFESSIVFSQIGFHNGSSVAVNNGKLYLNGALIYSQGSTRNYSGSYNFFLGAVSLNGNPNFYNNAQIAFTTLGATLTATDAANLYTRVQAFQTTLGRQV